MSTIRRQEPVGLELRRIACDQVEAAIRCLTRESDQAASTAAIGNTRAVLALVEADLPRANARRDRLLIDRLGAGLAQLAGPVALRARLNTHFKKTPADADLAGAVKVLGKKWSREARPTRTLSARKGSFDPAIYRLVADMAELRGHIGDWPVNDIAHDAPPAGLRRSYARARRLAGQPIDVDGLAELVDVLEQLSVQLGLVGKACVPMIKAQRKLLSRGAEALQSVITDQALTAALGEQLEGASATSLPDFGSIEALVVMARERDVAAALAETPAAFFNRIRVYWSAWRGESENHTA